MCQSGTLKKRIWQYPLLSILSVCMSLLPLVTARASGSTTFSSSRKLLLKQAQLPAHYRYRSSNVIDSVLDWDQNIRPVYQVDIKNGWLEGAQEFMRDPKGKDAGLSVQLFRTHSGAMSDFGSFFTNAHPETIYVPGQHWLGGIAVSGIGDRATLYRVSDSASMCPSELLAGLSYVFRNALFSVQVCLHTVGESGARNLALKLLSHARTVH